MKDNQTTVEELKQLADNWRQERGWDKYHSSQNLAISIALEAAELLENYQWSDGEAPERQTEIQEELADIWVYCLHFAVSNDIDISQAVQSKLKKAAQKYPVETFNKDGDLKDYLKIKRQHRS